MSPPTTAAPPPSPHPPPNTLPARPTRARESHPGLLGPLAQRGVDAPHGAEVAPVQILEHQQDGMRTGLGLQEVEPRLAHLLAHELGVLTRGLELGSCLVAVGERRADE